MQRPPGDIRRRPRCRGTHPASSADPGREPLGRLAAQRIGTQHVVEESDLEVLLDDEQLAVPREWGWDSLSDGQPMPNIAALIRRQRAGH